MATCSVCEKELFRIRLVNGVCIPCIEAKAAAAAQVLSNERAALEAADRVAIAQIILTTEASHNLLVDRRLDIISAEVVIGLHVFKDIAGAIRDVFGGRSEAMQNGLREARRTALDELRREALSLGADAVVGVDLDYSEISGGGKSMLFLVASGTAVTLQSGGIPH